MGKLNYFTMASLDGFIDRPDRSLDWVIIDEELHRYLNERERGIGAYLYGRRMYELMQAYWPTADTQSDLAYMSNSRKSGRRPPRSCFPARSIASKATPGWSGRMSSKK